MERSSNQNHGVRSKIDSCDEELITVCQTFMNHAVAKYNKIISKEGEFKASITSVQKDIVAIVTTKSKTKQFKRKRDNEDEPTEDIKPSLPPWITHFQSTIKGIKTKYKVGDKKTSRNEIWYYYDCPNHRDKAKWHTHSAESCITRQQWLKSKQKNCCK